MSCFSCLGCCVQASEEENEPLSNGLRIPKQVTVLEKGNKLNVKRVNVPAYDEKFTEISELYNKQVEYHQTMKNCLYELNHSKNTSSLTGCIETLKTEYSNYDIKIQIEGYNFSLGANETKDIPDELKRSQDFMKQLSKATILLIGNHTKLGGMVFSLSQERTKMANTVQEVNTGYLDQIRLVGNLDENFKNIDKAKELSEGYEEEAKNVLKEIAVITGVPM